MSSFEELQRIMSLKPGWRCSNCGERDIHKFHILFEMPFEAFPEDVDHIGQTFYVRRSATDRQDDLLNLRVWCASCDQTYPLPEGWKVMMR